MKKKFLLLILSCTLLGSLAWALAAADKEDPLASLSYLTDEFWETVEEAVDKRLDKSDQKLLEELELPEDQWFYEVQVVSKLVAEGNKEVFRRNMEISRNVMEVMEKARKSAGMSF